MLLLPCALYLNTKTFDTRSLVNAVVSSKSFQQLMLNSRRDMFQLNKYHMLLEFAFNQMFTPTKFPLDSHNFSVIGPSWDMSCDIALIVGTFIHGLGNYEAIPSE